MSRFASMFVRNWFAAGCAATAIALGATNGALGASCSSCFGDLDGNAQVDGADLGLMLGAWDTLNLAADLNNDGNVDGADLGLLLGAWGPSPCVPPNNACTNAITLLGLSGSVNDFCTVNATTDGPIPSGCGDSGSDQIGSDIWYRYEAAGDAVIQVSVCGDFDTRLAIYGEGIFGTCACPMGLFPAPLLACNDDALQFNNCSLIYLPVEAGKCYTIRIGGAGGAQGSGTLDINVFPPVCEIVDNGPAAAAGLEDNTELGISVDMDGDFAVVGAVFDDLPVGGTSAGSARVYRRVLGTWILDQTLTSTAPFPFERFGINVAISGDWIAVTAGSKDANCVNTDCDSGRVFLFHYDGRNWVFDQSLTSPGGVTEDLFGARIDLDGTRLIVGAPDDSTEASIAGAAYIYNFTPLFGGTWLLDEKLTASDASLADGFGWAVTLEGDWAAIGADNADSIADNNTGKVYTFHNVANTWTQTQILQPNDLLTSDSFGTDLDMEGGKLVIGGPHYCCTGETNGRVDVYHLAGNTWNHAIKLEAFDGALEDLFGASVSIDGNIIMVGAPGRDVGANNAGAAYVYLLTGGGWIERAILTAPSPMAGDQVRNVAVSSGNGMAAAYAADTPAGVDSGEVYFFNQLTDNDANLNLDLCE